MIGGHTAMIGGRTAMIGGRTAMIAGTARILGAGVIVVGAETAMRVGDEAVMIAVIPAGTPVAMGIAAARGKAIQWPYEIAGQETVGRKTSLGPWILRIWGHKLITSRQRWPSSACATRSNRKTSDRRGCRASQRRDLQPSPCRCK